MQFKIFHIASCDTGADSYEIMPCRSAWNSCTNSRVKNMFCIEIFAWLRAKCPAFQVPGTLNESYSVKPFQHIPLIFNLVIMFYSTQWAVMYIVSFGAVITQPLPMTLQTQIKLYSQNIVKDILLAWKGQCFGTPWAESVWITCCDASQTMAACHNT